MNELKKTRLGATLLFLGLILAMSDGAMFPLVNFIGAGVAGIGSLIINRR